MSTLDMIWQVWLIPSPPYRCERLKHCLNHLIRLHDLSLLKINQSVKQLSMLGVHAMGTHVPVNVIAGTAVVVKVPFNSTRIIKKISTPFALMSPNPRWARVGTLLRVWTLALKPDQTVWLMLSQHERCVFSVVKVCVSTRRWSRTESWTCWVEARRKRVVGKTW